MSLFIKIKKQIGESSPFLRSIWWKLKPFYYKSAQDKFTEIYNQNAWGDEKSVSGAGSNLASTEVIREQLPLIVEELRVQTLMDAPCGDCYWMDEIDLGDCRYIGVDIVPEIITDNKKYSSSTKSFHLLDIIKHELPQADLILCRDCLVHFSYKDLFSAINNLKASGSEYLLTTTFPDQTANKDIITGHWRPINLNLPPFNFPSPLKMINEQCKELEGKYPDKNLGLWKLEDLCI